MESALYSKSFNSYNTDLRAVNLKFEKLTSYARFNQWEKRKIDLFLYFVRMENFKYFPYGE